ncbi:MAG TPA: hypothetical protein VGM57_16975 [Pseudolabrys sp.]
MTAAVIAAGMFGEIAPASANCYRVLAPNRWQYITQCSNSGGGGGGGGNVGAAIGAAGAIIEAAPAAANILGGILNAGTGVMSGVASTGSSMMNSGADAVTSAIPSPGAQDGGSSNSFSIFRQPAADHATSSKAADCAAMRQRLAPHAPDNDWIVDQMARSGCRPNGKKMSMRERTKRDMEQQARNDRIGWQNPPFAIIGGALNSGAPKNTPRNNESTITGGLSGN